MAQSKTFTPAERIRITEIISRHILEPTTRDIFVEGHSDRAFIIWFSQSIKKPNIAVYSVDSIDIPNNAIPRGLSNSSNRTRNIALSIVLSEQLPSTANIRCIVDLDYEKYINKIFTNSFIRYTDYNSLELYLLDECSIHKFLLLAACTDKPVAGTLKNLAEILRELFLLRLTGISLDWNMTWVKLEKYITSSDKGLFLDLERYLISFLTSNSRWAEKETFLVERERLRSLLSPDDRLSSRGHDFTELLYLLLVKNLKNSHFKLESVERTLMCCADVEELLREKLFQEIKSL